MAEGIRYITQKTNGKLPIIAVGGIFSGDDAQESASRCMFGSSVYGFVVKVGYS
ncbi:MAG: hypothetical protein IPI46_14850 [Bacteroidetes bacterium]|nr:hypothetical protein [Bacteroidota bacterium]